MTGESWNSAHFDPGPSSATASQSVPTSRIAATLAGLDLQGREVLVVGAGAVATRRVHDLLAAGAVLVAIPTLIVFFALLTLLLIGGAAVVTFTDSWPRVWSTIGELGVGGIAAWSLVITVVAGLIGWLLLRKATPRT